MPPSESSESSHAPSGSARAAPRALDPRLHSALILEAAGEGIYGLDLEGRVTFANPAAARLTGHTIDELLHQPMHDLVHHTRRTGLPYPRCACPIYAALRDGAVHHVEDEVFWRKDGSALPIDYTSTPIFVAERLVGALVVFRDISERKAAERQLRRARAELRRLEQELRDGRASTPRAPPRVRAIDALLGGQSGLRRTMRAVERVAGSDATVLIQGESGTGKELLAHAVHELSARAGRPLVKVDCGALPVGLVESELFGHERGAFTGARARRIGRFERAHRGTLLLDEVGELPLEAQAKLLRALQEKAFERVGGSQTVRVDVRVIAATQRALPALVAAGSFRQDLFFRLNVFPLQVPPLRARRDDIPALVEAHLAQLSGALRRPIEGVSPESMRRLVAYGWPGNVRELHNVLERAAIVAEGPVLEVRGFDRPQSRQQGRADADDEGEATTLRARERQHIAAALARCNGKIAGRGGAAELLGLHANTLRSRMQRLAIPRARARATHR